MGDGKDKMWDAFLDDTGLDSTTKLVTFDDSDCLEGSSSTPADADSHMGKEEEEEEKDEKKRGDEFVDSGMEDY